MTEQQDLVQADTEAVFEEAAAPLTAPEDAVGVAEQRRMVEAVLFASSGPLSVEEIAARLPEGAMVTDHLQYLMNEYGSRGVNLMKLAGKYMFRTAENLAFLLQQEVDEPRKLSRAAVETLSIIAYHQPVTRAEIEEIRGVTISKGTLDVLMHALWVRMLGRRKTPGRPVTYGITEEFLVHFGLDSVKDLPGVQELKAAGLLDSVDTALDKLGGIDGTETDADDGQTDLEEAIAQAQRIEADADDKDLGCDVDRVREVRED